MRSEPNTLMVRFGKRASIMLVEFANCRPDPAAFLRFKRRWERVSLLKWKGDHEGFLSCQRLVREVWEGKKKGIEWMQVMSGLGIELGDYIVEEHERIPAPPIAVDWEAGQVVLCPRNLEDLVWLTLLQHSHRLGICATKNDGCATPYFLKYRPQQEFCSEACALPRQREFKRRWWAEHGKGWERKRRRKLGTEGHGEFWRNVGSRRKRRKAKEARR